MDPVGEGLGKASWRRRTGHQTHGLRIQGAHGTIKPLLLPQGQAGRASWEHVCRRMCQV